MNDNKDMITPNDINKFCYCPYQWYYEKIYGKKELRRLYGERLSELGISSLQGKNFERGRKFHDSFLSKYRLKRFMHLAFIMLAITIVVYLLLKGIPVLTIR